MTEKSIALFFTELDEKRTWFHCSGCEAQFGQQPMTIDEKLNRALDDLYRPIKALPHVSEGL